MACSSRWSGTIALLLSLVYIAGHFGEVALESKEGSLLLPLVLTFGFIPFLYVIGLAVVYQTTLSMVEFGMKGNEALYRYARRGRSGTRVDSVLRKPSYSNEIFVVICSVQRVSAKSNA